MALKHQPCLLPDLEKSLDLSWVKYWWTEQSSRMRLGQDQGQQAQVHFVVNAFLSVSLMMEEMKYLGKLVWAVVEHWRSCCLCSPTVSELRKWSHSCAPEQGISIQLTTAAPSCNKQSPPWCCLDSTIPLSWSHHNGNWELTVGGILCLLMSCFSNSTSHFQRMCLKYSVHTFLPRKKMATTKKNLNSCSFVVQQKKRKPNYKAALQGRVIPLQGGNEEAWSILVSLRIYCGEFGGMNFAALRWESCWRTCSCTIAASLSSQESRSYSLAHLNCRISYGYRGSQRRSQARREHPVSPLWIQE